MSGGELGGRGASQRTVMMDGFLDPVGWMATALLSSSMASTPQCDHTSDEMPSVSVSS